MDYKITLITLTYGNRYNFLSELVSNMMNDEYIDNIIIVNNGSNAPLYKIKEKWGEKIAIVDLGVNTGSANGYYVGIDLAIKNGAEYLWLMDDDNVPAANCREYLMNELFEQNKILDLNKIAVLGYRPDHQAEVTAGVPLKFLGPPQSSFCGFHFAQLSYKVWRRTPWGKPNKKNMPEKVILKVAPYGGLLGHSSMFKSIGLPIRDLILYADDTEYTYRLTQKGGRIVLVTRALIKDLEESWNIKSRYKTVYESFLLGGTDFRAYYGMRNQIFFDQNRWSNSKMTYSINKAIFLFLLKYTAKRKKTFERLSLILRAISDGENNRLGIDPNFKLQ